MTGNNIDPHWPHGHIYIDGTGAKCFAKIVSTNGSEVYPVVAVVCDFNGQLATKTFTAEGRYTLDGRVCLTNAPEPRPAMSWGACVLSVAKMNLIFVGVLCGLFSLLLFFFGPLVFATLDDDPAWLALVPVQIILCVFVYYVWEECLSSHMYYVPVVWLAAIFLLLCWRAAGHFGWNIF